MRAKLLRTTLRPKLLLGSSGSIIFKQRMTKALLPMSALLLAISDLKRDSESANRLSHCSNVL